MERTRRTPQAEDQSGRPDTVDVDKYDEYAQHLQDYYLFMQRNGIDLYAVSVQNEPDFADTWTGWSSENMVRFLRDHAHAIDTRVMAPESFQFRRDYTDPILLDSLASENTDIIGGHIYGGGNSQYELAEEAGKEIWMTEYLLNDFTPETIRWNEWTEEAKWEQTIEMLRTVHQSMKSNFHAYIWWYLRRYYSFVGDGEQGEPAGVMTKRGLAFSHFARFVRPGYVRLHSWGPVGRGYLKVYATAYAEPASGKLVLVAINGEDVDRDVSFEFDGYKAPTFSRYVTSASQDVEQLDDVTATDFSLPVTLPTKTVTTFVAEGVFVSNESVEEIPAGYDLQVNYPNPFADVTSVSYEIPQNETVRLTVFDVHGREVATLVDGPVTAGSHRAQFDGRGLSSGIYFYTLSTGSVTLRRSMLLAR